MNIDEFKINYSKFKDADKIQINCDYPQHQGDRIRTIGKQPAKRNILKNNGECFVCRDCMMIHNNPMNKIEENRQTNDVLLVSCPHPDHKGDKQRTIKKSGYYGAMVEPYEQICGSCSQLGKIISEEQKQAISSKLIGIKKSDEFKKNLSLYMKNNPEGIERATKTILANPCRDGMLGKKHSEETKQKQSEAQIGRKKSKEHSDAISKGRKKMLKETGGFTREHKEKISKSVVRQYELGFNPNFYHKKGWHESLKAGKVFFRSSYEKKAYLKLDADDNIKNYKTESITVEYFHPTKQITSNYLIDLEVEYTNGNKSLIEIKPEKLKNKPVIIAKTQSAEKYAKDNGMEFKIWSEEELFGTSDYKIITEFASDL